MGKNSLLKPTVKKKKAQKKSAKPGDDAAKTVSKAVAKKKSVKTNAAAPAKISAKKKTTAKTKAGKPALKDLIFKKFDGEKSDKPYIPPIDPEKKKAFAAPPFITGDKDEVDRIKKLLFQKYDMASLKAAAEKAAAEKAAAEKAAAEKMTTPPLMRAESDQKVTISYNSKKDVKPPDIQDQMMKIAVVVFVVLVFAVIAVSFSHKNTYYLENKNGAVEVWQGRFAPMGKTFLLSLPGAQLSEALKTEGSKKTIFPFVAAYYLERADVMLDTPGVPDFSGIQSYLEKAAPFAVTPGLKKDISIRSVSIHLMTLLYKSEVAAASETSEGYENALAFLEEARSLDLDPMQSDLVDKKLESLKALFSTPDVEKPNTGIETAPVEEMQKHQ